MRIRVRAHGLLGPLEGADWRGSLDLDAPGHGDPAFCQACDVFPVGPYEAVGNSLLGVEDNAEFPADQGAPRMFLVEGVAERVGPVEGGEGEASGRHTPGS